MPDETPGGPTGHLRPTTVGLLIGWGLAGLVGGWLLRPLTQRFSDTSPVVSWIQVLVLFFVAAILGATAWLTWRTIHVQGLRLEPHRAVNRLVLAKACALVGALVAGGYFGYAVSWLGLEADLAGQRMVRSALAGVAGVGIVVGAVLLERACRVRKDPDDN